MTRNFTKAVSAGFLTLSMAMLPLTLPVNAQVTDPRVETVPRTTVYERQDFDWGWLGLIGLFGLAGLAGKKRGGEPTAYREPTSTGSTTYRD
ncbi:WGxxGxxG family protein [Anabaena sp. CCY 0017]|uniref:WGxxGxxG family protein n=1 Tax=Anabaena sp. CCY 0017 TaxID=3103866 RepID=UPI0039C6DC89